MQYMWLSRSMQEKPFGMMSRLLRRTALKFISWMFTGSKCWLLAGIKKRQLENEEIEKQIEEEKRKLRLAKLGRVFTYHRKHFWNIVGNIVGNIPVELRRELVLFSTIHSTPVEESNFDPDSFEEAFWQDLRDAFLWQEYYEDKDDSDELMQLVPLLRRLM